LLLLLLLPRRFAAVAAVAAAGDPYAGMFVYDDDENAVSPF
jgi:hypothetical protein